MQHILKKIKYCLYSCNIYPYITNTDFMDSICIHVELSLIDYKLLHLLHRPLNQSIRMISQTRTCRAFQKRLIPHVPIFISLSFSKELYR